jgi:hypothetical protein
MSDGPRGRFYSGSLQKASCLLLCRQQRADFALQGFVAGARVPQKCIALFRRTLQPPIAGGYRLVSNDQSPSVVPVSSR